MNILESLFLLFSLPTIQWVVLGSAVLGLSSGMLGCFAVLRRQSLLGDALAHAALPGVCIAFLLTGTKNAFVILIGALVSGIVGTWVVMAIRRTSRIKEDAAIGIVLSVFFGIGVVLLTAIQHSGSGTQSGLDRFLFGQAASLIPKDVFAMIILAAILLVLLFFFYKEFKLLSFDRDFGTIVGYPMILLEVFLTSLIVIAVVIGIQTVGVVLMAAMLITPAVAARQWTDRLGFMTLLAGFFGILGGVVGGLFSGLSSRMPTGPLVVLTLTGFVVFSLFFAPKRGLVKSWIRFLEYREKVKRENILKDLHALGRDKQDWMLLHSVKVIAGVRGNKIITVKKTMRKMQKLGLVEKHEDGWRLTFRGLEKARHIVRYHRLWELYLSKRLDLPSDHVHRDAEDMEHALTPEIIATLEKELHYPKRDPHGSPIVQPKVIPDE